MSVPYLTAAEKASFDAIKQVASSSRPGDLKLFRMQLDGRPVAVIAQRLVRSADGTTRGFQPLARILEDTEAARLRTSDGAGTESVRPEGLEGAA